MAHSTENLLREFSDGRTDLVFDLIASGIPANAVDANGVALMSTCAYHGDVSAMRYLISCGARLEALGENLGLLTACFHGHWRLCLFLIGQGADVNRPDPDNGETALHAALCTTDRVAHDRVLEVLLAHGANPNAATKPGAETSGFMRDARTKGEMPLHRAAAFGTEATVQLLLDHGAQLDVRDANGDSPLSWGSWYARSDTILRMLCFGSFRIRPNRESMRAYTVGFPHAPASGS